MKFAQFKYLAFLAWALVASVGASAEATRPSVNVSVKDLKFYEPGKEKIPVANAYGDPASGAHINYIKMRGGAVSPMHMHSSD